MINSTNTDYSVTHDNELAYVLSKFNDDFVYSTVTESIKNKLRNYEVPLPNIIISFEQMFKVTEGEYQGKSQEVMDTRQNVYQNIIRLLCDQYQLTFNDGDEKDIYTSAMYMYSLLVSNFQQNIVTFFVNYIIREKSSIYDMLSLGGERKNKDSSTIYAKKVFRNPKLGVISANLEIVLMSICNTFDIDFNTYLGLVYTGDNKIVGDYLSSIIAPTNNFVKSYVGSCFNTQFRACLLTSIRLALQQYTVESELNDNTFTREVKE